MHKFDIRKGTCKTISKTPARSKPAWGSLMLKFDQAKWVNTGPSSDNSSTQQQATQSKQNQSTAIANKIGLKVASQTVNNPITEEERQLPPASTFLVMLSPDEEECVPPISDLLSDLPQNKLDVPLSSDPASTLIQNGQVLPPIGDLMPEEIFNLNFAE